jgi:MFS family permease
MNVIAGFVADRLVKRRGGVFAVRLVFTSVGLLGASSILILNILPGRAAVLPILVISICSFGLTSSNFWAIAQYTSPSVMVGRVIGYLNTLSQIAGVAAPLITGWTLGPHKNFKPAILIAGFCPLVSLVLLALAGPKRLNQLKIELDTASS